MNNSQDISGVVQGLVKEYIVPKYPIYRIKYVKTKLTWDDNGDTPYMITSVKCHLFEIKDTDEDGNEFLHPCDEIDFKNSFRIKSSHLQEFENKGHKIVGGCNLSYTIISAEKVA